MKILLLLLSLLGFSASIADPASIAAIKSTIYFEQNTMVPIPMERRVYNETGIQCVWASIECLGNYGDEPKLAGLTGHKDCKGYASPSSLSSKLKKLNVKFDQTVNRSDRSLILKSVVEERRGCLFAIPGHAMVLVHYDEAEGIIRYINNSDKSLKIRTWSMEEFNQRWDGWVCVIYPDNDLVYTKYNNFKLLPVVDKSIAQGSYSKDYFLVP